MNLSDVLIKPLLTEKSEMLRAENKYTFKVAAQANKELVREAFFAIFDIKPVKVNIMCVVGKKTKYRNKLTKRADWKKAIVTLKKGDTLDIFEGTQ